MEEEIIIEKELVEKDIEIEQEGKEKQIGIEREISESKIEVEPETSIISLDYNYLKNKPQINDVELIHNKSFENLGMSSMTNSDIENLLK